jgi:hypothetical protein
MSRRLERPLTGKRRTLFCCSRLVSRILPVAILLLGFGSLAHAATSCNSSTVATVNIHDIQTNLPSSPCLGDTVTTSGIVIAVLSDGFYIENSSMDSDVCTAEGIFVYTPSGVPSNAVLKNAGFTSVSASTGCPILAAFFAARVGKQ